MTPGDRLHVRLPGSPLTFLAEVVRMVGTDKVCLQLTVDPKRTTHVYRLDQIEVVGGEDAVDG